MADVGDDGDGGRAVRADARDEPDDDNTDEDEPDPVDEGADDAVVGAAPVSADELAEAEQEIAERFPGAASDPHWLARSVERWRDAEESRRRRAAEDLEARRSELARRWRATSPFTKIRRRRCGCGVWTGATAPDSIADRPQGGRHESARLRSLWPIAR